MAVPQITIRLSPSEKARFEEYASSLGLGASELAKILIVREWHQKRLIKSKLASGSTRKSRRRAGTGNRLPTVTAHLSSVEEVKKFDAYARECGLNRSSAGAWILLNELQERWLEKAIKAR